MMMMMMTMIVACAIQQVVQIHIKRKRTVVEWTNIETNKIDKKMKINILKLVEEIQTMLTLNQQNHQHTNYYYSTCSQANRKKSSLMAIIFSGETKKTHSSIFRQISFSSEVHLKSCAHTHTHSYTCIDRRI